MGRKPKSEEPVYSRLESVRTDRGITRQQLADAVDVHYQTIGYLERGEYSPSLALALRIADELATPIGALFSLTPFSDTESADTHRKEQP
jgi:DNA-binding XRE family transcriptional regulator